MSTHPRRLLSRKWACADRLGIVFGRRRHGLRRAWQWEAAWPEIKPRTTTTLRTVPQRPARGSEDVTAPLHDEVIIMFNTQLLHALPTEQARCRELVRKYTSIGSTGAFGAALIEQSLKRADRAVIDGDENDIRRALAELRAYEPEHRPPLRLAA